VLTRSALTPAAVPAHPRRVRFAGQLLWAELRLVRPAVWVASVLVMACAVGLARGGGGDSFGLLLSLVAPLLAVGGVAAVYGPESDPAFEVLAITPTSPRLVLLARVTLVFGYDLVLALTASALAPLIAPDVRLLGLVAAWLGPMTLLLALSLVLAMWIGPSWSLAVAGALWALRVVTVSIPGLAEGWLGAGMRLVWATNPGTSTADSRDRRAVRRSDGRPRRRHPCGRRAPVRPQDRLGETDADRHRPGEQDLPRSSACSVRTAPARPR
jgi:hypothetical protein